MTEQHVREWHGPASRLERLEDRVENLEGCTRRLAGIILKLSVFSSLDTDSIHYLEYEAGDDDD